MNLAVLIPALQPGRALVDLVKTIAQQPYSAIVIVNDGSAPEYDPCFEAVARVPRVHVLRHYVNVGKGAALKTGINFILCSLPDCVGVVTMDADGQHHPDDARKVAEALLARPDRLILGVRRFGSDVPLRSRFGNHATRLTFFLTTGQRLSDTQTGLRGIPRKMLSILLRLPSTGYEFELDMLLACKHQACPLQEVPIRTIYEKGNPTSHFNPLLDSLRIYFVLLRFSFLSLATAIVDNLAFVLAFFALSSILYAQIIGRLVAVLFNYPLAHGAVFLSRERRSATLPKYLLLVAASGAVSYVLINSIHAHLSVGVIWAKLASESALFIANFALQRNFVFARPTERSVATDWDRYYTSTPFTAKLTRKYTESVIVRALKQFGGLRGTGSIVEIGGAGLGTELVEDVDVVRFAVGNADKRGDVAMQVEQGVHLHSSFVPAELGPPEQRQAQVDGGRVQSVETLIQIHADRIAGVQGPRDANQDLREVGIDAPVARLVGVGESGARHSTAESHVVELAAHGTQAGLYIA